MTVLDTLRGAARSSAPEQEQAVPAVRPVVSRGHRVLLLSVAGLLLAGTLALLFGPARGMRDDIGETQSDLASSEKAIYGTLGTGRESLAVVRTQLAAAEQSLVLQREGLAVAQAAEQDTTAIREQTEAALQTVREVTAALGGADELAEDVAQAVRLAQAAVRVAEQTLATGREALAVARETLTTLKQSEQVQEQLLQVARETLEQTREINRKVPGAPVFPETAP